MTDRSKYDTDPEALAWARARIQPTIDKAERFSREADTEDRRTQWRWIARFIDRELIGDGGGCTITAFDQRRPDWTRAVDSAIPPAIDRAIRRDHGLCGTEPCSDCR